MGRKSTKKLYQFVDALVATGMRELVGLTLEPGKPLDDEKARTVMLAIAKSISDQRRTKRHGGMSDVCSLGAM